ncbi:alpha/beta hydrolase fold domain-containing protein [Streptomyces sp. NPDC046977]|uniref:alpha/beta hydrolase fold domain-containing protein n=1 Tax=Streptomyces sp. NPDC046977 TaxID=3154703 RepID=UPI003406023C
MRDTRGLARGADLNPRPAPPARAEPRPRGSAGGNIAAALSLLARDRMSISVLGQVLTYPVLEHRNSTASVRTPDTRTRGAGQDLHRLACVAEVRPAQGEVSPSAAPGNASDPPGLPPTFRDVGSAETFRQGRRILRRHLERGRRRRTSCVAGRVPRLRQPGSPRRDLPAGPCHQWLKRLLDE